MSFKSNGKPYAVCRPENIRLVFAFTDVAIVQRRPVNLPEGQWLHDRAPGENSSSTNTVSNTSDNTPSAKLVIENLHYEVSEKDLQVTLLLVFESILVLKYSLQKSLFGKYGPISRGPTIKVRICP